MSHITTQDATITVLLDQQAHTVTLGTTLEFFLNQVPDLPQACATAVNGLFVPRSQRSSTVLQSGDAILLFQPIVGG